MAWSSAEIPAAERALFAADKPVLVTQAIPVNPTEISWNASGAYGADASAAGFPARWCHDGFPDLKTKPSSAAGFWYVMMKFSTAVEFDCLGIIGHNLYSSGIELVALQIADDTGFTSNAEIVLTTAGPASDDRIMYWSLYHTGSIARRYAGVLYVRAYFDAATTATPQIGELVLGRRYQMPTNPIEGHDPDHLKDQSELTVTQGGRICETIYTENAFALDATWRLHQSADIANAKAWFKASKRSFVYCAEPTTLPQTWQLMVRDNAELARPGVGWSERDFSVQATEQGPDGYYMENE